jgi:glucokinase
MVADIGGTNARFALADLATLELTHISHAPCSRHATLEVALHDYLGRIDDRPEQAMLAVAAPVSDEEIRLTNSHWSFRKSELCRSCGLTTIHVVNDFEALSLSLPALAPAELYQLGGSLPEEHATKVVLGPGTGLGVAGLVRSEDRWIAVPGEGGHISLGAHDVEELTLLSSLQKSGNHMSAEKAISGPGLVDLYRAVAKAKGAPVPETIDVVGLALAGEDAIADEALEIFITWLGSFAGNIALAFGARGGVYIGGGIAPKITAILSAGPFRDAFEQKGRMRAYLAPIPVYVILAEFATLKGAAAALRAKLDAQAII